MCVQLCHRTDSNRWSLVKHVSCKCNNDYVIALEQAYKRKGLDHNEYLWVLNEGNRNKSKQRNDLIPLEQTAVVHFCVVFFFLCGSFC